MAGLKRRVIDVTFTLGEGTFGTSGQNIVKLSGLRIHAKIVKAGGPSMGTASLQIYGMKLALMNQLSTLGMAITLVRRNVVTVMAGNEGELPATVFVGTVTNAWSDFAAAPEVPFHVEAHTGLIEAVAPVPSSSYSGSADVATIMGNLATQMGIAFENNGVDVKLSNPYFSGSGRAQAQSVAEAAGIEWVIDNGKLAIWKPGSARGGEVPLISAATGMRQSPSYTSKGVAVTTLFNPSIGYGGAVEIDSFLDPAKGRWIIYMLDHDLAANVPRGPWFTNIQAARPGFVVVA